MTVRREGDFERLQGEIQDLIDELWQVPRFSGLRRGFRPAIDVFVTEDPPELHVVVELAGVDPATVQLFADERTLVFAGERRRPGGARRYQQMEIEYGPFQRRIALAERVDPSEARAEYRRGLLTIVLPIAQSRPVQERVTIQVGRPS